MNVRFVLGTAQLGMRYGIANRTGPPSLPLAKSLIRRAWENGVEEFDTAQAYGESEEILGRCFASLGLCKSVRVVTKLNPYAEEHSGREVMDSVRCSAARLGVSRLYGCLLHRASCLHEWDAKFSKVFEILKKEGSLQYTGVSIYDRSELDQALAVDGIDLIQFPFNVFDQRALKEGWFDRIQQRGKHAYVRSIFLQGLLLLTSRELSNDMSVAGPYLDRYAAFCSQKGMSQRDMAWAFAFQCSGTSRVVVGVETEEQLEEDLRLLRKKIELPSDATDVFCVPEQIINPALWPRR